MSHSITFILGTRPEIIKLSPVVRSCRERDVSLSIIHTGQHYSEDLDGVFFEQLGLPATDTNLQIGSGSHGHQTGRMISEIEAVLATESPRTVLVQGDTNSVLAGGIAASKLDEVAIGHVEAGLRSHDRQMPEEINRKLVDHVSDYLFAPTEGARQNLLDEGLSDERISVTGNTIVDAVEQNLRLARERSVVLERLGNQGDFALLTAHRQENVDDPDRFKSILEGVAEAGREHDLPVIYPIHPRAKKRINSFELPVPDVIRLVDPLNFLDFLLLEDEATVVLTDSGGVQEESCILGTPCVTLRDTTERPETVDVGSNIIASVDPDTIMQSVARMLRRDGDWRNPFGDGRAAERILDELIDER